MLKGTYHSEETKRKISEAMKGRSCSLFSEEHKKHIEIWTQLMLLHGII